MPDDYLDEYLAEVSALPVPDEGTEAALLSDARGGDDAAKKRVIEGLLLLTANAAKVAHPPGMSGLDAIQEANLVLVRIVEDPAVAKPRAVLAQAVTDHLGSL